jgi:asparagine synthase (glutamine-hydrolysing)
MSMAHSIENRVPFLDNDVVAQAFTIPEKYLLLRKSPEGTNTEKDLLKKMAAGVFGKEFAFRDKMGFGIPVREFFRNAPFHEYLNDQVLPGIRTRGLFNPQRISGWLSDVESLRYNELEALWVVVAFEIWASVYFDNNNKS